MHMHTKISLGVTQGSGGVAWVVMAQGQGMVEGCANQMEGNGSPRWVVVTKYGVCMCKN